MNISCTFYQCCFAESLHITDRNVKCDVYICSVLMPNATHRDQKKHTHYIQISFLHTTYCMCFYKKHRQNMLKVCMPDAICDTPSV